MPSGTNTSSLLLPLILLLLAESGGPALESIAADASSASSSSSRSSSMRAKSAALIDDEVDRMADDASDDDDAVPVVIPVAVATTEAALCGGASGATRRFSACTLGDGDNSRSAGEGEVKEAVALVEAAMLVAWEEIMPAAARDTGPEAATATAPAVCEALRCAAESCAAASVKRFDSSVSACGAVEPSATNAEDGGCCDGGIVIWRMPSKNCAPPVSTLHSGAKLGSDRPASETGPDTDDEDDEADDDEVVMSESEAEAVLMSAATVALIIARCADACTVSSN
jgi:hypothetical protein